MNSVLLAPNTPGQRGFQKPTREIQRKHKINYEIKSAEVRCLDPDGALIGVLRISEALRRAEELEMDLVEIAPQAVPPVCRIIDYGKYIYEQQKRDKIQKKNAHTQLMKEIRFKWRTDTHDFNFKTKHAKEFLLAGNKVKGSVMFRGREITHNEIGRELLEKFVEELAEIAKIDSPIRLEGKNMSVVLSPDKTKKKVDKKPTDKPKEAPKVEAAPEQAVEATNEE